MLEQPVLITQRLALRPYRTADAPDLQRLFGAFDIQDTVTNSSYAYDPGMAEVWIAARVELTGLGKENEYAVTRRTGGELLGGIGLKIAAPNNNAEMWYWICKPFWRQGYATEAGTAMLAFAFDTLKLNKVTAKHFGRNSASGRVLQKLGMIHEGTLRQHLRQQHGYEDEIVYAMLVSEWREQVASTVPIGEKAT